MTEPKLPAEPTSTSQDVLVSHEYIDYVSALREAAEKALELAAEREVEIERLSQHNESWALLVKQSHQLASDAMKDKEAANARAEAAEANDRRYRWLRDQHWTMETLIVTAPKENMIGFDCPSLERLDAAIDAMVKP